MPNSVVIVSGFELVFIFITSMLWIQPKWLVKSVQSSRTARRWGILFLGLTFLWSIILGAVLTLNDLSVQI